MEWRGMRVRWGLPWGQRGGAGENPLLGPERGPRGGWGADSPAQGLVRSAVSGECAGPHLC